MLTLASGLFYFTLWAGNSKYYERRKLSKVPTSGPRSPANAGASLEAHVGRRLSLVLHSTCPSFWQGSWNRTTRVRAPSEGSVLVGRWGGGRVREGGREGEGEGGGSDKRDWQ